MNRCFNVLFVDDSAVKSWPEARRKNRVALSKQDMFMASRMIKGLNMMKIEDIEIGAQYIDVLDFHAEDFEREKP